MALFHRPDDLSPVSAFFGSRGNFLRSARKEEWRAAPEWLETTIPHIRRTAIESSLLHPFPLFFQPLDRYWKERLQLLGKLRYP